MKRFIISLTLVLFTKFVYSQGLSLFRLKMTSVVNTNWSDEAIVAFRPTATRGYDRQFDAAKMSGSLMNISTVPIAGHKMVINTMPLMTRQREDLIIDVNASVDGQYNINFNGFQNIDSTAVIYLHDNYLNVVSLVFNGFIYGFTITNSDQSTQGSGRFFLRYGLATPVNLLKIIGGENTYNIYNTYGVILYNNLTKQDLYSLSLPSGVYYLIDAFGHKNKLIIQ